MFSFGSMKKKIFSILIIFVLCSFFIKVSAEEILPPTETLNSVNIHLTITSPTISLYDQELSVSACESDNPVSGNLKITPYCAIVQTNLNSSWNLNWAPGIFLNSINDIEGYTSEDAEKNPVYHYWSWSLNNEEAMVGLNQYELQENDLISLTFIDPIIEIPAEEPIPEPEPEPQITVNHGSSSGSSKINVNKIEIEEKKFNTEKAFEFLIHNQKEDGSFGLNMYTDWATIALASSPSYLENKIKLIKYYSSNKLSGELLTDYERYSIAIMSLGLNPYQMHGENYIEKITNFFDGQQFGLIEEINDDIFALIVLQNAGFSKDEEIIQKTIEFILKRQKANGSWNDNIDLTAATIQALAFNQTEENVRSALAKAKEYLKEKQTEDTFWGNNFSNAWAMQGILALGEDPILWTKNNKNISDYLAQNQNEDGSLTTFSNENIENKFWEISYILTSLSNKTWNQIMQKFEKENIKNPDALKNKEKVKKITKIENQKEIISPKPNEIEEKFEFKKENKFKNILKNILKILF